MKLLGIAGGSGTGKTSITNALKNEFVETITILSLDSYYNDNSLLAPKEREKLNFDHPKAFDFDLLYNHLTSLKKGVSVEKPTYSYIERTRKKETETISPTNLIILEGILLYHDERIANLIDFKYFIDLDEHSRLKYIIKRDVEERGRTEKEVTERFFREVNPMHNNYIEAQKKYADFIFTNSNLADVKKTILTHIKHKHLC